MKSGKNIVDCIVIRDFVRLETFATLLTMVN
jgi:hypothetical protein